MILFVVIAGLVVYGLVWLSMRARERRVAAAPRRPAPDDDPQFLAQLDSRLREQRRQAEQARRRRQAQDDAAAAAAGDGGTNTDDAPTTPGDAAGGTDDTDLGDDEPEARPA
ncbi:hypothetical protein SERN_0633 [Serinibacter arcticus]|uniref:Uncharacterized protein n=1 Tax=Serinibacter arcticus TaxID=1655435 RepID=A0A4Z1EAM4_9MICO|nr:hypothetical protein SERN_0633 [Serinibacter arcticus]